MPISAAGPRSTSPGSSLRLPQKERWWGRRRPRGRASPGSSWGWGWLAGEWFAGPAPRGVRGPPGLAEPRGTGGGAGGRGLCPRLTGPALPEAPSPAALSWEGSSLATWG